uniref:Uncharacterized protein n=1 Tax=Chenopodium quinoa TaxID=63459 RepID=A0A803LMT7_CHEQI
MQWFTFTVAKANVGFAVYHSHNTRDCAGDLNLSQDAFNAIVDPKAGKIRIRYANLLPKIFQFFNISLDNESPKVGLGSLTKIGILCLPDGSWKLRSDLTPEEASALPSSLSEGKGIANSSTSSSRLDALEFGLDDLRRDIHDRDSKLDQTHELLAIVNAKVNQLFHLSALTFTATAVLCLFMRMLLSMPGKNLPIPQVSEPNIITVEEYGVVKKYRQEEQRKLDEMQRDKTMREAHRRWANRAQADVSFQQDKK